MAEEEYWTKKDGSKIAVGAMDTDHLRNALRMVLRTQRKNKEKDKRDMQREKEFWEDEGRYGTD